MSHIPFLTMLVLVPGGAGIVIAALPAAMGHVARALALLGSVATLLIAALMAVAFRVGPGGFQMVSHHPWARDLGISWYLGIDGISLFLVLLTALLFPLAIFADRPKEREGSFLAWMLLLEAACMGSFLSLDLLLFFIFFEATLVPTYFMIGGWGFSGGGRAALKFFLFTFFGSAFLFIGILVAAFTNERATGHLTFALPALAASHSLGGALGVLLFFAFTVAFAVKAPIFPLHTWSPDAYETSPTAGVVVIAGIMAKLGSYGIIRFDFELFPSATLAYAPLLLTLAVIGIIYGSIVAARQGDLKRMMAYSSLAHLGFIVLGLFALTTQGVTGGILQMTNHGIFTAAIFLLIGMMYARRSTWQAGELAGLQRSAPVLAGMFTVAMLASIGLPGLSGFVGEFLILIGTFVTRTWWAVVATTGVVFSALYLLWAYQRVFHNRAEGRNASVADLTLREVAVMAPLVALMVLMGVFPAPVLNRITPTVNHLMAQVAAKTAYTQPAVARLGAKSLGGR